MGHSPSSWVRGGKGRSGTDLLRCIVLIFIWCQSSCVREGGRDSAVPSGMTVHCTIHSNAGSHAVSGHLVVGMGSLPQQLRSHWVQNTARIQLRGGEEALREEGMGSRREGMGSRREGRGAHHRHLQCEQQ